MEDIERLKKLAGIDNLPKEDSMGENLSMVGTKKAEYQKKDDKNESQKEMLENLEFDFNVIKDLKNYADEIGIGFLASAFDNESLEFLIDLKLDFIKIPSGEINNVPYLERISKEKEDLLNQKRVNLPLLNHLLKKEVYVQESIQLLLRSQTLQ